MKTYSSTLALNSLLLFIVFLSVIFAKLFTPTVGGLFLPPPTPGYIGEGLLTHAFQILSCVPPVVCGFSYYLLHHIKPDGKNNKFILGSAFLTAGFLINHLYRIHIMLLYFNINKSVTILSYALIAFYYGLAFRRQIKSTPYLLLFTGLGLLFAAIYVDSLHLSGDGTPSLLEGIPKLFSALNIALYFWFVCYEEVIKSFKR
ncbi:MAG TPA: hypothetical protein VK203_24955 [Nostocaceae cyanobacterium]|nr:hypothetical protein [Nostocaceae cyanobacterium]